MTPCPICGRTDKTACASGSEADRCARDAEFEQFGTVDGVEAMPSHDDLRKAAALMTPDRVLTLPLRREYFDAIREGRKVEEYRLATAYWQKRIEGRTYDRIVLTLGYPKADDASRRIERPWKGAVRTKITHPHFGPNEVEVFAINVGDGQWEPSA